jgi:hypothetical protein
MKSGEEGVYDPSLSPAVRVTMHFEYFKGPDVVCARMEIHKCESLLTALGAIFLGLSEDEQNALREVLRIVP